MRKVLHKFWKTSAYQSSNSQEEFQSYYQPGGTLTEVFDQWTSRVVEKGSDPFGLGRWSYIILRGKENKKIAFITGYRVGNTSAQSAGPTTAFMQQYRALLAIQKPGSTTSPALHKQFILDLQSWIEHLIHNNHQIILALDNNEEINPESGNFFSLEYSPGTHISNRQHNGALETLMKTCNLVDIATIHHTYMPPPETYNRGKKWLDYILVSKSISHTVIRSGTLPYYSIFQGDHRPCFIDLDATELFQEKTHPLATIQQRGLQLSDPSIMTKYKKILKDQLEYHNIEQKKEHMRKTVREGSWSEDEVSIYETIDRINSESMLYAERQVQKKFAKKYEWSPKLIQAVQSVRYWKLRIKKAKGLYVTDHILNTTLKAANLPTSSGDYLPFSIILSRLKDAREILKQRQCNHVQLREEYLESLAEAILLHRNPNLASTNEKLFGKKKAKQIKALKKREFRKRLFKKISNTLADDQENFGGLVRVDIPATNTLEPYPIGPDPKTWTGPWCPITDPDLIAKHVCAANTRQYNQAENTPFGTGYLADHLKDYTFDSTAPQILQGSFPIPPDQIQLPETRAILNTLATPLPLPQTTKVPEITVKQFQAAYRTVKEATSSSPFGRHVGHYKAAATDNALSALHATMMSIPYQVGFSPQRWQQTVDIMLEKTPGDPKPHL